MYPIEDLSNTADSNVGVPHFKPRDSMDSLSSSSSSETLKSSPASVVHVYPKGSVDMPEESDIQKLMDETASMLKMDIAPSQPSSSVATSQPEVTISTSGSSVLDHTEVEEVARTAVDEVIAKVNDMESKIVKEKAEKKPSKIPISKQSSLKSITVMNISDDVKPIKVDVQIERPAVSNVGDEFGSSRPKLLRDDSKSRLMQTVADANDIKISPVSPGARKDSSSSSSSSSSQSSPDIRADSNPAFTEARKTNGTPHFGTAPANGQTIEISANELDGIMMSHSDFLSKQASMYASESPPKDSSFDNWVYVDQKHSQSQSSSPSEPSASSHDDDDDANSQYSRSGALSPTTFKMETEYGASELKVTSSGSKDPSAQQTKVYSTTMTLPQKTITQIVLSPEAGQNISVVDGNFIVSKVHAESGAEANQKTLGNLPILTH
jgi:hypothetical protein